MNRLSIQDLAHIVGGKLTLGQMPPLAGDCEPIGRVAAKLADVQAGDVFWDLGRRNPHSPEFLDEAYSRGALGVVTAGRQAEPWAGRFALHVEDAAWSLWQLAHWVRESYFGRVIAVTGDVGKTTARAMIAAVLGEKFRGVSPAHTLGGAGLDLSLNLLELQHGHDFGLFEFGSPRRGEIRAFSHLCSPEIGVINSAAMRTAQRPDAVAEARELEMLDEMPAESWAIVNGDLPGLAEAAKNRHRRVLSVGRGSACDVMAGRVRYEHGELSFRVEGTTMQVPVHGRHHLHAALAAVAAGKIFGLSLSEIAAGFRQFQTPAQRCEVFEQNGVTVIDDTYDSRPTTTLAALEVLRDLGPPGRRIMVCGELETEAGQHGDACRLIGDAVVGLCGADLLIAFGRERQSLLEAACEAGLPRRRAIACPNADQAGAILQAMVAQGDAVLVKGGHERALNGVLGWLADRPRSATA